MFNLKPGQWAIFLLLTIFTFFGGFLYLLFVNVWNRQDIALRADPRAVAIMQAEADAKRASRVWKFQNITIPIWIAIGSFLVLSAIIAHMH